MSILDLDFYKLTMLQFIWKHYADVPVTFRLHSRKQDLASIVSPGNLMRRLVDFQAPGLTVAEYDYLLGLGMFEQTFLDDLSNLLDGNLANVHIGTDGTVLVSGDWFKVSLWETVILSAVSEQYSTHNVQKPSVLQTFGDIRKIHEAEAWWADFGTRRRWSAESHAKILGTLVEDWAGGQENHLIGTSNVHLARQLGLTPIGTYAHELEMVLRTQFKTEFDTTRDVLTKWQELYPWRFRVALTDTYTTPKFLEDHGKFLLDNDWRGVRLDSGHPMAMGWKITDWLDGKDVPWDIVFSDGLDAETIVELQREFGSEYYNINPVFGWGTGLTNPNTNLSLVMKAVRANGKDTYKITDDETKAIR